MSKLIGLVGSSSTGKTTSLRNLAPAETYIINVLGKTLPWRGAGKTFNAESKNLANVSNWNEITAILKGVSTSRPEIKQIVIDDATFIMTQEFMLRAGEPGFNKFSDIAQHMFSVLNTSKLLREDLAVIVLFHDEMEYVEGTKPTRKIKTIGKMTDNYVDPKALFTILLYTDVVDKVDNEVEYTFLTNRYAEFPAKSPMGMFKDLRIPNDMNEVLKVIRAFEQ